MNKLISPQFAKATLQEQAGRHANVLPIIDADIIDGQFGIVS